MEMPTTVMAIAVISGMVGYGAKLIPSVKDEYIPFIVGITGGILGVLGMHTIPQFPAQDILDAIAVGIASGLASTGLHQMYKQVVAGKD